MRFHEFLPRRFHSRDRRDVPRKRGVKILQPAGLQFHESIVSAPVTVEPLRSKVASPHSVALSASVAPTSRTSFIPLITDGPMKRSKFRPMNGPLGIDGCSITGPGNLPERWRLLLPILQRSISPVWSNALDFPSGCQPYPYQWEGVKALADSTGFLLADDMGTGKTVQALLGARILLQKGQVRSILVLAPISVLPHWEREADCWLEQAAVDLVRGTPEERKTLWTRQAHIKLTAYETLRQDEEWLAKRDLLQFDLVILDEAQRIKNAATATARAVQRVSADRRWGLTGTPLENRIEEVRAICSYIRPGLFKSTNVTADTVRRLLKPHLLRRRKEEVLKDLPSKKEFAVWLRMGSAQQQAYNEMEERQVLELSERESITATNILTLILELKKICNRDPRSGESVKGEWLQEALSDITNAGDKALVFTQFRQPQFGGSEWLRDNLHAFGAINYAEAGSDRLRESFLRSFESDHDKKVFIGHPRTAGLGINQLVTANYVIHFDHWWNPAITNQATARAHRPKQTKQVFVYHLWVEGSIEEMILRILNEKQALFDLTIDALSTAASEQMLFQVYRDLMRKYGLVPRARAELKPAKES
jgi:SNF2 family DNA or RNA helicase